MNLLKLPKNRITSIDISQLNSLNATVRKICGRGSGSSGGGGGASNGNEPGKNLTNGGRRPCESPYPYQFHSAECKLRKGNHMAADRLSNGIGHSKESNHFIHHMPEPMALHASDCELVLSRTSDPQQYMREREECFDSSATNLKYCSLISNKRGRKQADHLMHSTYYNFEDADFDLNDRESGNAALDATLLSDGNLDQIRVPWKHRRCPSIVSSSSGASITKWDPSKHWLAVTSILLIAGAAGVAVPLALRVSSSMFNFILLLNLKSIVGI